MFPPGALKEKEIFHNRSNRRFRKKRPGVLLIDCHYSRSNKPQTVDLFPQCLLEEVHQDETAFPATVEEANLPENVWKQNIVLLGILLTTQQPRIMCKYGTGKFFLLPCLGFP